jgi:hypothetical protein
VLTTNSSQIFTMARTKKKNGKRITASKVPRKTVGGKGKGKGIPVISKKRQYKFRPGSKLINRKINTFTN